MAQRNRGLKPRTRNQYSNEQHGRRDSSVPPDDRTLNMAVCRMTLVRPKYKEGPLVIRPWPALDFNDTSKLVAGRESTSPRGVSHFIVRAPVAKYIGLNEQSSEKFTFILYEPWLAQEKKKNNPYRVLYFAAKNAFDSGRFGAGRKWDSDWNQIMKGKKGFGAEMSGPTAVWFMQGEVLQNGDKDYTGGDRAKALGADESDDLVVIQVSGSAGDNMLDLVDTEKPNVDADADAEPWRFFKYGDPSGVPQPDGSVKGGLIYTFFNPGKVKVIKVENKPVVDVDGKRYPLHNTSWDGKIEDVQGYEVAVSRSFEGRDGDTRGVDLTPAQVAAIAAKWSFWWDDEDSKGILNVPSPEEQCEMIARAYAGVPKLVEYCWADHEQEFMTDAVKGILAQRRSAVMPGDESEYDEEAEAAAGGAPPVRRQTDPTQGKRPAAKPAVAEDDSFEEEEAPPAPKATRKPAKPAAAADFEDDEAETAAADADTTEADDAFTDAEDEPETAADVAADGEESFEDTAETAATEETTDDVFAEGEEADAASETAPAAPTAVDDYFEEDAPAASPAKAGKAKPRPAAPPADDAFEEDDTASDAFEEDDAATGGDDAVAADDADADADAKMRRAQQMAAERAGKRTSPPPTAAPAKAPAKAPAAKAPAPAPAKAPAAKAPAAAPAKAPAAPAKAPAAKAPAAAPAKAPAAKAPAPAPAKAPAGKPAAGKPAARR